MKNAARLFLLLALVCATARAAPTSKLTSEWFVPLDSDSGRFALVDTATGVVRIGIMNPDGKTGFSQVVPTGITEVSDTASGILGAQGEEIVLTAPAANRVIRVTAAAEFPLAYVFQPLGGLGTSGVSESESTAARKLLISSLANAPDNISKLELRDPLTGALITELNSPFLVQRLEPMTNPADGNRVSIGVNTTATGTVIRVSQPPENRLFFSSPLPHEVLTDVIGSAGARHFIAFRNGFAAARIFTAALPITKTSSFSSASVNFPFPVSALLRVPGGGDSPLTDGVIALAADGTQALWLRVNAAGNGFITTPHSFTPDPGSALTGLLPMPQGVVQLSGAQAGGVSTDFKGMAFDGTDWVERSSGSLPALPSAGAAAATLLFMDRDPFISNGARVVGMQSVPDWTRRTNSEALPASVVREVFQSSADGLRFNSTQAVTQPPGTNFVLANQADPAMSVVTLGTAASVFTPSLRVEPPSGSYDESFQVTAIFDAKAFKLRFRRDGGPWQDWAGPLPVAYTTSLQFALQSLTGGAPGPVQTRSYLFTANKLLAQDSDGDGVPDFVELQKGLDPFGGADHDGDGISDLDELIRGTNPADANDPRGSTLESPGGNSPVLRGAGLRLVALPFDVQGRQMNIEQPVQMRTLTGGLLAEGNTAVIDPKLPDNTDFGARLSTSASVPVQELVALSTPESFRTGTETVGREIIRFVPADPPPQLSVAVTPTGTNLAGDANAWITAAQAAAAAVPFTTARTRLDPPDMAVSVLLEHLVHRALTVVRSAENPAPPLEDFSLFSGRTDDGGRVRINEDDKVLLITRGFEFRKALTESQNRRTAMSALANGIYAKHSATTNPPSLEMPLDILRSVLRGADLPAEYAGAATAQQITEARAAYDGAVAAAAGNFRESESIEVQIPSTFLGQGVYLGDIGGELEPVVLFRLGRRFFLDQEFGAQPGTRFLITAFTDLPPDQGRVALDVTAVQFLSNPPSLDRDSDSNGLDDEWERFFFGAIGQDPGFIPPGHTKTLAQLFASGEDPRALAAEPNLLVEQPAGNALAPLAGVNFGVMGLNSSQNLVFTVRNIGRADLTGLGISFSGDQASSFSVTLEPLTPVTPQGLATFTVRFRPTSAGSHSAVMAIASNDPDENPFQVQLSGTGVIVGHPNPGFSPVIGSANIIAVATQPDGKILAGGALTSVNGQPVGNLARFNVDGSLDTSFNTGTGASSSVICVSVLADGKILVGGNFTTFNGATATRIVRLNSNGSTDGSFSAAFSGGVGTVTGIVPQTDGRLVVVGNYTSANGQPRNRIVRLLSNGTLDGSFNPGSGADNNIRNAVVQPDGRIVIAGDFANVNGQPRNQLARLNADGSLESTAGFNPGTGPNGIVRALSLLPDGQIMIGGSFATVDGFPRPGLAILSSTGSVTSFTCSALSQVFSFIRQTDGRVIIGGSFTSVGGSTRNRIARITPGTTDGSSFGPDTTFNVGSGANGTVNAVALAANGSVIVGGTFSTMNALPRSGLAVLVNSSPATNITVTADNRILWSRSGTAPEIAEAEFDVSDDGGATFTPLGTSQFIAGGWQMTGLENLPAEGLIRVRAALRTGQGNSSAGLVQTAAPFSLNASSIPFISSINPVTTNEDTPAGPFSFTVSDVHTAADRLLVTAVSSNATLLPASGIALGGAGGQRTITLTPAQDQFGTATVTVRAFDGARTGTRSFTFTVQPVNDVPEISPIADQAIALGSFVNVTFAVSDVETPAESLVVTAASSNTAVIPLNGIVLTGGSKREARITPAPGVSGSSTITLTVSDGVATAQSSFQVTVNNSAPVISPIANVTLNEDFSISALVLTVSDNETPAADLVVTAESTNSSLLPPSTLGVFGSGGNRFVSIQPAPNQHGSAVVTVRVSDGLLATETSFTVTVLPVNDAPVIAPIANLTTLEDTPVTVQIAATDVDGPVMVLGAFQVNPQPGAQHALVLDQAAQTLTLTPPPDFHGTATFTVTVNDARLSDSTSFTLTVLPVNDAPSFTKGPNFAHPFGFDVPQQIENWATELSPGPANESAQGLSFRVLSISQPSTLTQPFFAALPTVTPEGRLNYRTRGLAGTSIIRLVIEDDGGTENGGVNRSVEQTFTITVGDAEPQLVIETLEGEPLADETGEFDIGGTTIGGVVTRALFIRNAGQAPLILDAQFAKTGEDAENFQILSQINSPLAPGQRQEVPIRFAPVRGGIHTALLSLGSIDANQTRKNHAITLRGRGVQEPTVVLNPPAEIQRDSLLISALVHPGDGEARITLEFGLTPSFEITFPMSSEVVRGSEETLVQARPTGLRANTFYFYRVTASNEAGVSRALGVFSTTNLIPGTLNPFFLPQVEGRIHAIAVQPDGRILIGGDFTQVNGTPRVDMARLNFDGSLDPSFNANLDASDGRSVRAIAVQQDGRIIAGGSFETVGGSARRLIARLQGSGDLDNSFLPLISGNQVSRIVLRSDGRVLIGGDFTQVNLNVRTSVARLNVDGTLDAGFNTQLAGPAASNGTVNSLAVQADGRVLIGGKFLTANGAAMTNLVRVNDLGSVDFTFVPEISTTVECLMVLPGGGILVGGRGAALITRLNVDGSADPSFAFDTGITDFVDGAPSLFGMAAQADGSLVIAGDFILGSPQPAKHLARLLADGSLDTEFTVSVNQPVECLALQADGRVLIGGRFNQVNGLPRASLARLANDLAAESLEVVDGAQILWRRGFSAPEASDFRLHLSTDGGLTFGELPEPSRMDGGWFVFAPELAEETRFHIRATTRSLSGAGAGSSGLTQVVRAHNQPDIQVLAPDGTELVDAVSTHDFGDVPVTQSSDDQTFVLNNTGTLPLTFGGAVIDGPNAGDFTLVSFNAQSTSGGSQQLAVLKFNPTALGQRTAILRISSNDPDAEGIFEINLRGTGVNATPPKIAVFSPFGTSMTGNESLSLGTVRTRTTKAFTFRIENQGSADLTNLSVSRSSGSTNFTVLQPGTTTLRRGQSTLFTVNVEGKVLGPFSATLRVTSNDSPFSISVNAIGTERQIEVLTSLEGPPLIDADTFQALEFGLLVPLGSVVQKTLFIRNPGTEVVTLDRVKVTGEGFTVTQPDTLILQPGRVNFAMITVSFSPQSGALINGKLEILSDVPGPKGNFEQRLRGGAGPEISVDALDIGRMEDGVSTLAFPDTLAGRSVRRTLRINNIGSAELVVDSQSVINVTPAGSEPFSIQTRSFRIPGLGSGRDRSQEITIFFTPASVGSFSGVLRIVSNDADKSSFDIALSGECLPNTVPIFTQLPQSQIVDAGKQVTFTAAATAPVPLTFQWQRGKGQSFSNFGSASSNPTLVIPKVALADAQTYRVTAKGTTGEFTSPPVHLSVVESKASRQSRRVGSNATFSIKASGVQPLSFQWKKNGSIVGGTARTLTRNNLQLDDAGAYTCTVTGPGGILVSQVQTLEVFLAAPVIAGNPLVLPDATVGKFYNFQIPLDAESGRPTTYSATKLPAGLSLDATTGRITGRPRAAVEAVLGFRLTARNSVGTSTVSATLRVLPLPANLEGNWVASVERGPANQGLGGLLNLQVSRFGEYSAKLTLGSVVRTFTGFILVSADGQSARLEIDVRDRIGAASLRRITCTLNRLTMRISDGKINDLTKVSEPTSDGKGRDVIQSEETLFKGWFSPWSSTNPPVEYSGYHTFIMDLPPGAVGLRSMPQGLSFGAFVVPNAAPSVNIQGKLADGTGFTSACHLGPDGDLVIHQNTASGSISGIIDIQPGSVNSLRGTPSWQRPANARSRVYGAGFGPLSLKVTGGAYRPAASGSSVLGTEIRTGNAKLSFAEGGIGSLPSRMDQSITLGNGDTALESRTRPRLLNFNVSRNTGFFTGKFTIEDINPSTPRAVIVRDANIEGIITHELGSPFGGGFFLLPQLPTASALTSPIPILSGSVLLEPVVK